MSPCSLLTFGPLCMLCAIIMPRHVSGKPNSRVTRQGSVKLQQFDLYLGVYNFIVLSVMHYNYKFIIVQRFHLLHQIASDITHPSACE